MMEPSLKRLLVLLAGNGVRFVVVGGVAVILQGYARLTEDVDLLVDTSPENIETLLSTLRGYGQGYAAELTANDFDDTEGAIRLVEESEFAQIDIFTRMSGLRYADLLQDAEAALLQEQTIHYASKASLIRLKEMSLREKDRMDVMALRRLQANPRAFD